MTDKNSENDNNFEKNQSDNSLQENKKNIGARPNLQLLHFFSISFREYDKKTLISLTVLYLAYFIGTSFVYISTLKIFNNHIISILIFSLCFSVSVLYYKNFSYNIFNYPLELRKNDNDSKILALVSSFLIFLSGTYNFIVFHQQSYNEIVILTILSFICYFAFTFIYCNVDKFLILSLEKRHRENKIFIEQIESNKLNSKVKRIGKIGLIIVIILCLLTIYLKFFSDITTQIHNFWDYYNFIVFFCILIFIKILKKLL